MLFLLFITGGRYVFSVAHLIFACGKFDEFHCLLIVCTFHLIQRLNRIRNALRDEAHNLTIQRRYAFPTLTRENKYFAISQHVIAFEFGEMLCELTRFLDYQTKN